MHIGYRKTLWFSFFVFFVFFSSCATRNNVNLPPPKSVILYASDSPEFMQAFAKPFTARLNSEKIFYAQENQMLSESWVEHTRVAESAKNKEKLTVLINEIKNTYQTKPLQEAKIKSQSAMTQAEHILLDSHMAVASEYAELAFWVAVVNFDEPAKLTFPANVYLSLATAKERATLEEQTSPKIVSLITKSATKGRHIKLKTQDTCSFYANGKLVVKNSFKAISGGNNVFTAHCNTGDFAQAFNPQKTNRISVVPRAGIIEINPPTSHFPVAEVEKLKVDSAILIYYSNKGHYIDADVYDVHAKKFYTAYKMDISNENNRKNAGNELVKYLRDMSYKVKSTTPMPKTTTHTAIKTVSSSSEVKTNFNRDRD